MVRPRPWMRTGTGFLRALVSWAKTAGNVASSLDMEEETARIRRAHRFYRESRELSAAGGGSSWCRSFLGWLLIWGVSWMIRPTYRSGTLILVEQPSVPENT